MQVFTTPKTILIVFLFLSSGILTSCSKEHDLVSDFVIVEKVEFQKITKETTSKLLLSNSIESKQVEENFTKFGK